MGGGSWRKRILVGSSTDPRPDGRKKAYVRLTADFDALEVANKVSWNRLPLGAHTNGRSASSKILLRSGSSSLSVDAGASGESGVVYAATLTIWLGPSGATDLLTDSSCHCGHHGVYGSFISLHRSLIRWTLEERESSSKGVSVALRCECEPPLVSSPDSLPLFILDEDVSFHECDLPVIAH